MISFSSSQRAYMLAEALAYITVLLVLLGVGFAALYRAIDGSIALRRNADDHIAPAIHDQIFADDALVGPEALLPAFVAHHRNRMSTRRHIILG